MATEIVKVLFLSQIVPYPPHGGVLQRGYNLLRELGRKAEVHLLAFVHPDELRTEKAVADSRIALERFCASVEYFPLWAKASPLHHVAAIGTSAWSDMPLGSVAYRSKAFGRRAIDLLRSGSFDLVHADTIGLDQYVPRPCDIASVLTHHNIESQLMERRAGVEGRWLARKFIERDSAKLRRQEIAATPRYDVNILVSPYDERTLQAMQPSVTTAVVPNGVDVEYFTPAPEPDSTTLIYTGGMNMFANRDAVTYFLDAIWPLIVARVPNARFVAVGQDPPADLLARAARDSRIVVPGYVDDIRPFVRETAVYVVPLRVGGGTRLKVLDAMAMGKAMVSTSIGCEGIDAGDREHLLKADTPDAFAEAVIALLGDRGRRATLGAAARAFVLQSYAWSIVGERLIDAYDVAIAAKKGRRRQVTALAG